MPEFMIPTPDTVIQVANWAVSSPNTTVGVIAVTVALLALSEALPFIPSKYNGIAHAVIELAKAWLAGRKGPDAK